MSRRRRADFSAILVYDVSRWGRFQDADESAYYEYICKRAGITVHYCAEQFENDGSPAPTIVKGVKRVMVVNASESWVFWTPRATDGRSGLACPHRRARIFPRKHWFLSTYLMPGLPAGLLVQHVLPSSNHLIIVASLDQASASCPSCAASSSHVHSRYERTLGDPPCQGQSVTLRVEVRRFRCPTPLCPRQTFAERMVGIAPASSASDLPAG